MFVFHVDYGIGMGGGGDLLCVSLCATLWASVKESLLNIMRRHHSYRLAGTALRFVVACLAGVKVPLVLQTKQRYSNQACVTDRVGDSGLCLSCFLKFCLS